MAAALCALGCGGSDDRAEKTVPELRSTDSGEPKLGTEAPPKRKERPKRETRPATAGSGGRIFGPGAERSFAALEDRLGAQLGVSAGPQSPDGRSEQLGDLQTGAAWSTIKVPLAIAAAASGDSTTGDTRSALTESDNQAADRLWQSLISENGGTDGAAAAVGEILRAGDDGSTTVSTVGRAGFSPYGQTQWRLSDQRRFAAALAAGCIDRPGAGEADDLMGQVVADQRWGLGTVGAGGRFKGGWGPDPGGRYLVRQFGTIASRSGGPPLSLAIAARPADGSFGGGTQALSELARWTVAHARPEALEGAGGC